MSSDESPRQTRITTAHGTVHTALAGRAHSYYCAGSPLGSPHSTSTPGHQPLPHGAASRKTSVAIVAVVKAGLVFVHRLLHFSETLYRNRMPRVDHDSGLQHFHGLRQLAALEQDRCEVDAARARIEGARGMRATGATHATRCATSRAALIRQHRSALLCIGVLGVQRDDVAQAEDRSVMELPAVTRLLAAVEGLGRSAADRVACDITQARDSNERCATLRPQL